MFYSIALFSVLGNDIGIFGNYVVLGKGTGIGKDICFLDLCRGIG